MTKPTLSRAILMRLGKELEQTMPLPPVTVEFSLLLLKLTAAEGMDKK